jgi:hypothetical protein
MLKVNDVDRELISRYKKANTLLEGSTIKLSIEIEGEQENLLISNYDDTMLFSFGILVGGLSTVENTLDKLGS